MERRQPLLHRIGEAGARFGTRPPRSAACRLAIQLGSRCSIFGFLVLTVVDQWSEIQAKGVHFHVLWLIPAFVILPFFYALSALGWDLTLRFLGYRIGAGRAQVAWGQPLLARYVPGSVLYVLGRVLLSERAGVPRRIDGRQHRLRTGDHRDLGDHLLRLLLHQPSRPPGQPAALGVPAADPARDRRSCTRGLRAARGPGAAGLRPRAAARRDLAARVLIPARSSTSSTGWWSRSASTASRARSATVSAERYLPVGSAQALGYVAALAHPRRSGRARRPRRGLRLGDQGRGARAELRGRLADRDRRARRADRGRSALRGTVTALGRREGWTIHTGVLHASPEEERADEKPG